VAGRVVVVQLPERGHDEGVMEAVDHGHHLVGIRPAGVALVVIDPAAADAIVGTPT
jgi:hypothetical protein